MGRKRIPRGKAREPITISLPRDLIIQLDQTIPEDHSRSKVIERLVKSHLTTNTTLKDFQKHHYSCIDCGRSWIQKRFEELKFSFCIGDNGCNSSNIEYNGVWSEEE